MKYDIPENTLIDISVLRRLPERVTFIGIESVTDMDRVVRRALRVKWVDHGCARTSRFCADTGEYLGDC